MPRPSSLLAQLHAAIGLAARSARLAIGLPDYETYVRHRRQAHPGEPVMSYAEFFKSRQEARYARGATRCC